MAISNKKLLVPSTKARSYDRSVLATSSNALVLSSDALAISSIESGRTM